MDKKNRNIYTRVLTSFGMTDLRNLFMVHRFLTSFEMTISLVSGKRLSPKTIIKYEDSKTQKINIYKTILCVVVPLCLKLFFIFLYSPLFPIRLLVIPNGTLWKEGSLL